MSRCAEVDDVYDVPDLPRIEGVLRMSAPATRILLVAYAAGDPAAVLEEALMWARDERRPPHELHALALPDAARRTRRELLSDGGRESGFTAICRRLGLNREDIVFNTRTVHTLALEPPAPLVPPIEQIWQLLRGLCRIADSVLTALVRADAAAAAVMIHAALQLVGRPDDRLLVGARRPADATARRAAAGRRRPDSQAYIEIPVLIAADSGIDVERYMDQVERRRQERRRLADPDPLTLDCRARQVRIGETVISLPPRQFYWLSVLARPAGVLFPLAELSRALHANSEGQVTLHAPAGSELHGLVATLRRGHAALFPHRADEFGPMLRRACGAHPGLPSTISKINATFRHALGSAAPRYLIEGGRDRGGYRLQIDPRLVRIEA